MLRFAKCKLLAIYTFFFNFILDRLPLEFSSPLSHVRYILQITDTILCPEVAFTGDTKSDVFLDPRNADALRAKILITEVKPFAFSNHMMHLYEISLKVLPTYVSVKTSCVS